MGSNEKPNGAEPDIQINQNGKPKKVRSVQYKMDEKAPRPDSMNLDVKRPSMDGSIRNPSSRKASFFIGEHDQMPVMIIGPDNEEICPEDVAVPPDGGWGWVIVFAAFMSNVIVDGTIFSFGIVLVSIVESAAAAGNPVSVSTISWVGGSLTGFYLLAGPFVSSLSNKFGFRVTAIAGTVVASLGLFLAWFFCRDGSPNMMALFIFYGVVGGIGFGLIYVPAVITVGFYFEKKRALATGIAICGSGIGTFLYAPLVKQLSSMFEWQGAVLAQAGIVATCAIFASLYRPLTTKAQKRRSSMSDTNAMPTPDVTPLMMRIKRARDLEKWDSVNSFVSTDGNDKSKANGDSIEAQKSRLYESARKSSTASLGGVPHQLKQKRLSVPNMLGAVVAVQPEQPQNQNRSNSVKKRSFVGIAPPLTEIEEEGETTALNGTHPQNKENGGNKMGGLSGSTRNFRLQSSTNLEADGRKKSVPIITLVLSNTDLHASQSRIFRVNSKNALNKPMHRDDIFYSGSLAKIPEAANKVEAMYPSVEWQAEPISESLEDLPPVKVGKPKKCWDRNFSILKKMLDFSLLKSFTFLLLAVAGGITMLGFFVPFMYLKAIAVEDGGLEGDQATLLISVIGIANTFGRVICGGVADKLSSNVLLINNVALTVGGVSTMLVPFLNSYPLFILYSCLFGMSIACFASLRSILIVELLGLSKLTNAFGLLLLFQGLAAFVGSPLAGFLRDATGDYGASFYVAGSLILLSAILCYPINIINKWEINRQQNQQKGLNI